eukprot:s1733_g15.t1
MDLERLAQVEARPGGLLAALRERGTLPSFGGMTSVASPPRLDLSPAPITRPAEEVPPEALKSRPTPQRTQKPTAAKSKPKLGASKDGFEPSASEARPGLRKAKRPPVPAFALKPPEPEPWQLLRQIQLSDKKEEENYEISEKGSNSEAEEEPDRSHKRTPDWSLKFLELLETQADIDADTIFGSRVPRCDLEEIFTDRDYLRYAADRPAPTLECLFWGFGQVQGADRAAPQVAAAWLAGPSASCDTHSVGKLQNQIAEPCKSSGVLDVWLVGLEMP